MGKARILTIIVVLILGSVYILSCGGTGKEEDTQGSGTSAVEDVNLEERMAGLVNCDWQLQFQPDIRIVDIEAVDPRHIWALGNSYDSDETNEKVISYLYKYDGTTWSELSNTEDHLSNLYAYDENHIWATGSTDNWNCVIYFYDGKTFTKQHEFIDDYENSILDMVIIDPNHIWVLYSGICCCGEGLIYFFDGNSWTEQLHVEILAAMDFIDSTNAWAVGSGGLYSYDGQSWSQKIDVDRLFSFCAPDKNSLWATDNSYIYFSDGNSNIKQYETRYLDGHFVTRLFEKWEPAEGNRLSSMPYPIWAADSSHVWVRVEAWPGDSALLFFDGSSWIEQCRLKQKEKVNGFIDLNEDNVWAIGNTEEDNNSVLFYNGSDWMRILEISEKIYDICPVNDEYVLVALESGIYASRMELER